MVGAQINHSQIEDYAKKVAEILGENHFANQDTIKGQEILKLSEVKQINFFVLKNLFEKWQEETRNLRSPYFNFKSEKVIKALGAFMNILSQNIEMEKAAFMPLLTTAVQDTLYLTLTPFDHFWAEISQGPGTLSIKNLKAKGKYIKQNKHIYDAFVQNVTQAYDDKVLKTDALNLLEALIQGGTLEVEDNGVVIDELSQIHSLDIEAIYTLPEPEVEEPVEEPQSDEDLLSDLFDEDTLTDNEESGEEVTDEKVEQETINTKPEEVVKRGLDQDVQAPRAAEKEVAEELETELEPAPPTRIEDKDPPVVETAKEPEPAAPEDKLQEEKAQPQRRLVRKPTEADNNDQEISDNEESLNKKYSQEKTTINDQLKDQEKVTIADIHETQPIGKMQESISVNQRYMFINELFSGNAENYNKAINDIERCESFDDSVELMIQKYAKKLDWNMNSPEVKELLKVIFKRYR